MVNILRMGSGGAKDKCRLLKLGNLDLNGPYYGNGTVSASFNVKDVYEHWNELTLNDFCQPVVGAYCSFDGGSGDFTNFTYSYSNGLLKVTAKQRTSYCYISKVRMAIYIIDRFGGGVLKNLIQAIRELLSNRERSFLNG